MRALAAVLLLLAATDPRDYSEGPRARASVVYVGTVAEVRKVGSLGGPKGGRMEATLKDPKVVRGPQPADAATPISVRYDQEEEPATGGGYYRVAAGDVVVVFARSLDKEYPLALVSGTAKVVADELRARRQWLTELDADALRAQGVTEAQRAEQVKLYDQALGALGLPLK